MTTLTEISSCAFANTVFHSQDVKYKIALLRDARSKSNVNAFRQLIPGREKMVSRALYERRQRLFLDEKHAKRCGTCSYCLTSKHHPTKAH